MRKICLILSDNIITLFTMLFRYSYLEKNLSQEQALLWFSHVGFDVYDNTLLHSLRTKTCAAWRYSPKIFVHWSQKSVRISKWNFTNIFSHPVRIYSWYYRHSVCL